MGFNTDVIYIPCATARPHGSHLFSLHTYIHCGLFKKENKINACSLFSSNLRLFEQMIMQHKKKMKDDVYYV